MKFDPFLLVPAFVKHQLLVGENAPELTRRYREGVAKVWVTTAPQLLCEGFTPHFFDGILVTRPPSSRPDMSELLVNLERLLAENGVISMTFSTALRLQTVRDWLDRTALNAGLMIYHWREAVEKISAAGGVFAAVLVKTGYNPVEHALQSVAKHNLYEGIRILDGIPLDLIPDEAVLAAIAAEKQRWYLELQKSRQEDPPHKWFSKSQREFAQATAIDSGLAKAYQTQAEYWRFLGDQETGKAVWRSFLQSSQSDDEISDYRSDRLWKRPVAVLKHTEVKRKLRNPRILVLGHSSSDYGMDTLYDGLCRVIGGQNVVEYPSKRTLHGVDFGSTQSYPCTFTHPRGPSSIRELIARLEAGRFDLILYADVVEMNRREEIRLLLNTDPSLPLVVYDSWDDCYTPLKAILEYIDRPRVDLVFKREMLSAVDYGCHTLALPFSYPASLVGDIPAYPDRTDDVFWAGKREFGLRPIMIERVEKKMNRRFDQTFDQTTYRKKIRQTRIGLALWGYGFDTVRFWEIPAHGGMLLAQRPPIRIPNNFVDGHSAVFFDDLYELEEKLTYCLNHPEAAEAIAAAGHQQWETHHTTAARASQMLSQIEQRCGW